MSQRRRPLAHRPCAAAAAGSAVLAGLTGLSVALAAPASAHDELVSSSPAAGATVNAPSTLTLTYSEALVDTGYRVVVRGPDGTVDGDASLSGTRLVNRFASPLPAGPYDVIWRVVSADGHPISGRLSFTVRQPAATSPTTTASSTTTSSTTSSTTTAAASTTPASTTTSSAATDPLSTGGSGGGRLLTFGLIAAVIAAGAAALAAARRTRGGPGA